MDIEYKSSQATTDLFRAGHSRIPKEQVQENTSELLDYIEKIDLSKEIFPEKIYEYEINITNLLKGGAKITVLTRNDTLLIITNFNLNLMNIEDTESQAFYPFLKMLKAMSSSNDEDSFICAQNSKFHDFLTKIILNSVEFPLLKKAIKIVFNFIYEKPRTADLFNYDIFIKKLYDNYNNFFFYNHWEPLFTGEEDINKVVQKVVIPSFELVLVLLVYNPNKSNGLDDYAYRLVVTVQNILLCQRSYDENMSKLQIKMILFQLHYILTNTDENISDRFSVFAIVQAIVDNITYGEDISIYALECLKEYALHFSGAYMIIHESKDAKKKNFVDYIPTEKDFSDSKLFIKAILLFCEVWINVIMTIVTDTKSLKSRRQSAKIDIQNNSEKMLEFFKNIDEESKKEDQDNITKSFEFQKILSLTFIAFANYNEVNTMEQIFTKVPDIVEKVSRILEERNPEDIFKITKALINIINHFVNTGSKNTQIGNDLGIYKSDILDGLEDMRTIFESPDLEQVQALDRDINQIGEMLTTLFPNE